MSFQTNVNLNQNPGVEGGFASANPRASVVAGAGAIVAGSNGCNTGRFAWVTSGQASNSGSGVPTGFCGRDTLPGAITTYLGQAGVTVAPGYPVPLYSAGDFWVTCNNAAAVGEKIFANLTDGSVLAAAAGTTVGAISITAAIADTGVMTVSAIGSGTIIPGMEITGTGVPAGTYIQSQLSGTTGSTGTYQTNTTTVVASTTITASAYVETKWYVSTNSDATAGDLVVMTTWN